MPKQIASKDTAETVDVNDLDFRHMAFLLRRSLFTETKKKDIRISLA